MDIEQRIKAMTSLGGWIKEYDAFLQSVIDKAHQQNPWFTRENTKFALRQISEWFLDKKKLEDWVGVYKIREPAKMGTVGLVLAGNIPLVGFHDVLCVFISGHKSLIKTSSKDNILLPCLLEWLAQAYPESSEYFELCDKLKDFDAIIATGSNNSVIYFEYYFGKYPSIIRKNRNGVAVLHGSESGEQLEGLCQDIFSYFGLGCRNVSKIYIPKDYNPEFILDASKSWMDITLHNKYMHNYDYNFATYILNKENILTNEGLILREHHDIASRIASLHFERYASPQELKKQLVEEQEQIQCIVSGIDLSPLKTIPFGTAQSVQLHQYADDVDTMKFLNNLENGR